MTNVVSNLKEVEGSILKTSIESFAKKENCQFNAKAYQKPNIIAVTKNAAVQKVLSLIEYGHIHFGENKVQEAVQKYEDIKPKYPNIKLHLIGSLQTNKVKKAVSFFDFIHSVDRKSLADELKKEFEKQKKQIPLFIQVNTTGEETKGGVSLSEADSFINYCKSTLNLPIIGLMTICEKAKNPNTFFAILASKAKEHNLNNLSMGMSDDYQNACLFNTTYIRLGTKIMGSRS
jgi:pyridoxal phosphate enzyme (YggS family)